MSQITVKTYVKPLQSYVILFGLKITAFGSDKSVRTTIVIYDIRKTQSDGENIYTYYTFNKMNKLYLKNIILKSFFLSFFGCHVMNLMPPDLTWTENLLLYWMLPNAMTTRLQLSENTTFFYYSLFFISIYNNYYHDEFSWFIQR